MLVSTSRAADLVPIVRVTVTDYHHIAHAMDVGACGIVVPLVESPAQIKRAISFACYPPLGTRGCAFGLSHDDIEQGDIVAKMRAANDSLLVIAQIQTVQGMSNLDEVVTVDGVDAIWVGQYDWSISMGNPGQFDHAEMKSA